MSTNIFISKTSDSGDAGLEFAESENYSGTFTADKTAMYQLSMTGYCINQDSYNTLGANGYSGESAQVTFYDETDPSRGASPSITTFAFTGYHGIPYEKSVQVVLCAGDTYYFGAYTNNFGSIENTGYGTISGDSGVTFSLSPVPEPSSIFLAAGGGLASLVYAAFRSKRAGRYR